MTIEEIKAEIVRLEPEAEACWREFKRLEAPSIAARDRWYDMNQQLTRLRNAVEVLEPRDK